MAGFPSPFEDSGGDIFDGYDQFVPKHIPESGPFLEDHELLAEDHHIMLC